jgi:hypothetical protein
METAPTPDRPPIDDTRVVRAGRLIDLFGQAMLPVGIGAVAGFYAADQGMRLLPTLLEITLGWSLSALALIALGKLLRGKLVKASPEGVRLRKRVVFVLVLMALALGVRLAVHYQQEPSPLSTLSVVAFEQAFAQDAQAYRDHERGMERLLLELELRGVPAPGKADALSAEDEALLLDAYAALLDYAVALDAIRMFWEDWYRFDPSRVERRFHLRSYLLTYAAELALYEKAARFSERVLANPSAKKFLDVPHPSHGLPENSFSHFRQELLGTRDQARVVAGERYLQVLDKGLRGRQEAQDLGVGWLWDASEQHLAVIEAVAPIDRAALTVRADAQILERSVRRVWFPVQKETADWMGDVRVRRVGWYLIPPEQQAQAAALLEPGDIMIARKNWYLSNVGLPGFWPHAILHIGSPEDLEAWSDDPAILEWIELTSGERMSFPRFLEAHFPTAWLHYRLGHEGETNRVIEAIGEGVVFNTMAHVSGDYLAAVRPRLDKLAKAQAIAEAFAHWGKPYDFDFDFATDHTLVCTELVWRAYRPAEGKQGLDFPMARVAGRVTLPANLMAQHFADSLASPEPGYDFVLFIDAIEKERRTFFSDQAAFAATPSRTKWDIAQQ